MQAHPLELECLSPPTDVAFFLHRSRLATDFKSSRHWTWKVPKLLSYLDENNSITNKLYAECKNPLQPMALGRMIKTAALLRRKRWSAETSAHDACDANAPRYDHALLEFGSRAGYLCHACRCPRHERAFLPLPRHRDCARCLRAPSV